MSEKNAMVYLVIVPGNKSNPEAIFKNYDDAKKYIQRNFHQKGDDPDDDYEEPFIQFTPLLTEVPTSRVTSKGCAYYIRWE